MMRRPPHSHQQNGFVLITSIVILLAMTLLGIALVRSIDTATLVSNNLGFRQSALASSDLGTEKAAEWINANKGSLTADNPNFGYYATEQTGTDFTGKASASSADDVDWTGGSGNRRAFVLPKDPAGNTSAYIIQRMCSQSGAFSPTGGIQCATTSSSTTTGGSKGGAQYGSYAMSSKAMIHYRVTTRATGPKNTISFVQTTILVEY